MFLNKRQNCTLTDNGTNQSSCLEHTDSQCQYEKKYLTNPSFEQYYYPWCYFKKNSYMLYPNNRTENCGWPCNDSDHCHEKDLGIFNSDGSMNPAISRQNIIKNQNYNWCFNKNTQNKFDTPNIEICNIPGTNKGTYPNCSDCIIKAGGGASCTDILMRPSDNKNLNNIGFKHYPLIQIAPQLGFNESFLKVPTEQYPQYKTYTWAGTGDLKIYYKDFGCDYNNSLCEDCSCVLNTLKTTFIIPQNSTISNNGKIPYVIIYGFEQNNAYNWGWPENKTYGQEFPMFTADKFKNGTSIYSDNNLTNTKTYFETIKQIVYSGIAVIGLANNFGTKRDGTFTDTLYDYGPYLPEKPQDLSSIDSTLYWNNGQNFLNNYLKELMDFIYINPELDYNRCGLMGYSLGAQMVSRLYNEFPTLYTKSNTPFPNISCGIMIAGGTLHCFEDKNPKICPPNQTEPIYDNGQKAWHNHPATLLFQNIPDSYSDSNATANYFNTLANKGVPCYLVNKHVGYDGKHAIAVCNNKWDNTSENKNDLTLTITILFLLKYL